MAKKKKNTIKKKPKGAEDTIGIIFDLEDPDEWAILDLGLDSNLKRLIEENMAKIENRFHIDGKYLIH